MLLATPARSFALLGAIGSLMATSVLLCHQGSYNDMTFLTAWWCSLWCVWYSTRIGRDQPEELFAKAAWLGRIIASLVLLGGAVGKWTPEYWSGDVFYEIYFRDRDFWSFNLVRDVVGIDQLPWIAMVYSRLVIMIESLLGLTLWCLPTRFASCVGIMIFVAIVLLSNFDLTSVLAPMIGLVATGLWVGLTVK